MSTQHFEITGKTCYQIASEIFPIFRSITGEGVRKTLSDLKKYLPEISVSSVPSGSKVFDWTIPPEWNCEECYIEDSCGKHLMTLGITTCTFRLFTAS